MSVNFPLESVSEHVWWKRTIFVTRHSSLQQVPPLTPSTNKKINESLKETYATWGKDSERLQVPRDPQSWSKEHVGHWLSWAIREFNLTGLTGQFEQFQVRVMNTVICGYSDTFPTGLNCSIT